MKNADKYAFPSGDAGGLTKREYAAIHILAGMLAVVPKPNQTGWDYTEAAVNAADLLFTELDLRDGEK